MSLRQFSQKLVIVAAGLLLALPLYAGEVPSPVVPKAKAKANEEFGCVEPLEVMRKNHMQFILHQRDETMYKGIRTSKHSLAECINCHVAPEQDGSYARYGDDKHFCSTCHTYAAVNIDCFGCHRDTPEKTSLEQAEPGQSDPHHKDFALNQNSSVPKQKDDALSAGGVE